VWCRTSSSSGRAVQAGCTIGFSTACRRTGRGRGNAWLPESPDCVSLASARRLMMPLAQPDGGHANRESLFSTKYELWVIDDLLPMELVERMRTRSWYTSRLTGNRRGTGRPCFTPRRATTSSRPYSPSLASSCSSTPGSLTRVARRRDCARTYESPLRFRPSGRHRHKRARPSPGVSAFGG
jgi:hypothetical protein